METKGRWLLLILAACFSLVISLQTASGDDGWRSDFDATCAQSNDAMALSVTEPKKLIEQCDSLQKVIESQEETVRKVFMKRLQMCRNLYVFVLETKMQEQKSK